MAVLQVKPELHRWVAAIGRFELNSLIKLLVISVVVLPILPNRGFGPAGLLNPFEMWWMVVLISLISFVGYFAIRILGPRLGTALTGLFGGLASSTAVTLNFSRFGRRDPTLIAALAGGVGFASTIMYLRVAVVATVVNSELGQRLWLPMLLAAGVSGIAALILSLQSEKLTDHRPPDIGDPTDIANALIFGVLLVGLTLLSHFLRQWAGDDALLMVAAAGGLVDVDAVTLTMSRMANGQLDAELLTSRLAVTAILIAVVTNTLVKASIVIAVCGGGMAWRTSAALGSGLIAALAGFWLF